MRSDVVILRGGLPAFLAIDVPVSNVDLSDYGFSRGLRIEAVAAADANRFISAELAYSGFLLWVRGGADFRTHLSVATKITAQIRESLGRPAIHVVVPPKEQHCTHVFGRGCTVSTWQPSDRYGIFQPLFDQVPRQPLISIDVIGRAAQHLRTDFGEADRHLKGTIWKLAYALLSTAESLDRDSLAEIGDTVPEFIRILVGRVSSQLRLTDVGLQASIIRPLKRRPISEGPGKYRLVIRSAGLTGGGGGKKVLT